MVPQGSRIESMISVAGQRVTRSLSDPSEFTMMHLDTYADYLKQIEPRTEGCASVVDNGWTSNKETPRELCGSLWSVSGDV